MGSGSGFGGGGGVAPTSPNPDTIRVILDEKAWHEANSMPATANLHVTPADQLYGFKTYDFTTPGLGAFATFSLPHSQWTYDLGLIPVTKVNLILNFYHSGATPGPVNNALFNTAVYIFRKNESVDFAKAGGTMFNFGASIPSFQLMTNELNDIQIDNPSGLTVQDECMFFIKLRREIAGDLFPHELKLIGGVIEFPLS